MVCCLSLKFIITTIIAIYGLYLYSYKCPSLDRGVIGDGVDKVLHPLTHHHNKVCDGLNKGVDFASPYVAKVQQGLDQHVFAHPLAKQYEVESKLETVKAYHNAYVWPYVIKMFEYIEILELHLCEHLTQQWAKLKLFISKYT